MLLVGIFCTLCIFIADASLHLSFNLLRYLLEINLNNYLLPLAIAELSRSTKNKLETHRYTLFPSVIRRKTNERGSSLINFLLSEELNCMVRVLPVIKWSQNCDPNSLADSVHISRCSFVRGRIMTCIVLKTKELAPYRKSVGNIAVSQKNKKAIVHLLREKARVV